jgi:hypothetical protein
MSIHHRLILFPVEGEIYVDDELGPEDNYFGLLLVTPMTLDIYRKLATAAAPLNSEIGNIRITAATGMLELLETLPPCLEAFRDDEKPVLIPRTPETETFTEDLWNAIDKGTVRTLATECVRTEVHGHDGDVRITFYQKHIDDRLQSGYLGAIFRELARRPEDALRRLLLEAPSIPEGWERTEGPVREYFDRLVDWDRAVNDELEQPETTHS